jgi:AraC-like DNA-binding protein
MLSFDTLLSTPGLTVSDVRCRHPPHAWEGAEVATVSAVVFARRGVFRRRGRAGEQVIEPGVAYLQRAGEEDEFAHPHGGDACTAIGVGAGMLASLLGGDPALPHGPVPTDARDDLAQRVLLAAARRGEEAVEERALELVAAVLGRVAPARVAAGRPATATARRRLAADAREALAADPALGLPQLARAVGASPHHLSRTFRAHVGVPVSLYRRRLRLRDALERLAGGERDLARVAAEAGFADHAHLTREARALLGATPSSLRDRVWILPHAQ